MTKVWMEEPEVAEVNRILQAYTSNPVFLTDSQYEALKGKIWQLANS